MWQMCGKCVANVWQVCGKCVASETMQNTFQIQKIQCSTPEGLRLTDIIKQHFVRFEHVNEMHAPPTETCPLT